MKELAILFAPQSHAQKLFIRIPVENYQVRNRPMPQKSLTDCFGFDAVRTLGLHSWNWQMRNCVSSTDAKHR
jgi:hypothetical protein